MANVDSPFGLRPVMHVNGAPYNGSANLYLATDTDNWFIGDAVIATGESNQAEFQGMPPGSVPHAKLATVGQGNRIGGVVVGFVPVQQTSLVYKDATRNIGVWVADDPDILFEVQDAATLGQTAVGGAHNLIATHSGSTSTGLSGQEITTATGGTGAQVIVQRASSRVDNDIASANAKWLVRINLHTGRASVGDV